MNNKIFMTSDLFEVTDRNSSILSVEKSTDSVGSIIMVEVDRGPGENASMLIATDDFKKMVVWAREQGIID